jgi:divalent metal cation (Fe/Co/Zn/Cd) transporter
MKKIGNLGVIYWAFVLFFAGIIVILHELSLLSANIQPHHFWGILLIGAGLLLVKVPKDKNYSWYVIAISLLCAIIMFVLLTNFSTTYLAIFS